MASSKAVLGTITTDANGEGIYTITKDNGNKELTYGKTYTLLQTAGDSRYSLADASGETKGDTGGTQPAFPMTVTTNDAGIIDLPVLPEGSYTIHQRVVIQTKLSYIKAVLKNRY